MTPVQLVPHLAPGPGLFERMIFSQDQRVVESQRPAEVPVDLAAELTPHYRPSGRALPPRAPGPRAGIAGAARQRGHPNSAVLARLGARASTNTDL